MGIFKKVFVRKWNGVRFKQIKGIHPDQLNCREGALTPSERMITFKVTPRHDLTVYHELGHFYNGDIDKGVSINGVIGQMVQERKAWITASLMIETKDIDYFISEATICLNGYSKNHGPYDEITRMEILKYRRNHARRKKRATATADRLQRDAASGQMQLLF